MLLFYIHGLFCTPFINLPSTLQIISVRELECACWQVGHLALFCKSGLLIEEQIQQQAVTATKHPRRTKNCLPEDYNGEKKTHDLTFSLLSLFCPSMKCVHLWDLHVSVSNSSQTKICL